MGDAFIVRRGGGGGLSKCSIIVHIDSGSTVAAYSNASATTKVKDGKEIGTSGDYLITGLNTGTYYVKATKNTDETISGAIVFSADGIIDLQMSYAVPIFGLAYQSWSEISNNMTKNYVDSTYRQFNNTNPTLQLYSTSGNQLDYSIIWKTPIPAGKSYLNIRYASKSGGTNTFGLSSSSSSISSLASTNLPVSTTEKIVQLSIASVTSTAYVYIKGPAYESDLRILEVYVT